MNTAIRQQLIDAAKSVQVREIMTLLYRDRPQGVSLDGLMEMFFLNEAEAARLAQLVENKVLTFDGQRYKIAADARQILDRDPTILMEEFLR